MKFHRYPERDAIKHYFPLPNEIFCLVFVPARLPCTLT